MEKMASKKRNKVPQGKKEGLSYGEKGPPPQELEKGPTNRIFPGGASAIFFGRAYTLEFSSNEIEQH